MKHAVLAPEPDEVEAEGPFEIAPEWPKHREDDDSWVVKRPTTKHGKRNGIHPGPVATCPNKAHALAVCDALNAFDNA